MAEHDPPAAKVDVSGRPGRRRKGRKGKAGSPGSPQAAGTAKAKVRPAKGARVTEAGKAPRAEQQPQAQSVPPVAAAVVAEVPATTEAPPAGRPASGGPPPRQSYAAIDLGTNNCRLLIARPSGENFTVIDAFSRVVRLGEGIAQSGRLSDAAMERTLSALRICADKLMRRNVYLARSVATEACRRAVNGPEFIERVRKETGIALDIISAREEARLAVLGCHVLLEDGFGPAMIFDIGGGSTELVLIESTGTVPRILDWQSVPWGVVSLTESCGGEGATREERREVACIGRERADLVVAGCAILEAILDLWPAARLGVADRGIREGILRSLIASHSHGHSRGPGIRATGEAVRNAIGAR